MRRPLARSSTASRSLRRFHGGVAGLILLLSPAPALHAQAASGPRVAVIADDRGSRLQVDGRDFLVKGVNWDYFPIGTNYAYSLWTQPDATIQTALDREMALLKAMGVNAIRQYNGIPPKWVRYIYERWGIFTVLNHPLGRYGTTINGVYSAQTNYADPKVRAALIAEVTALVDEFRGTPGVLMWLLGNENNYGLTWKSAATENLPAGERDAAKARFLYSLVGEAARALKQHDTSRPVAFANGDLQYLEIFAAEAKGIDVFGTNVYRGASFGDLFTRVKQATGLPVMFTEFGADAWNARTMREDQVSQAKYVLSQWREIYEHVAGQGQEGNAIGGFTFQWTDGWWKYGQESRLDEHDVNASWSNAAYADDYVKGQNNMNEEWWGIAAKGPTDSKGFYDIYPRAAYYGLQQVYQLDPYAPGVTASRIGTHFAAIEPAALALKARGDKATMGAEQQTLRVSGLRMDLQTISTGGDKISTPARATAGSTSYPAFKGFDHLESYYATLEARPTETFKANVSLNVLGNVPTNPIDEIFYENRGRTRFVPQVDGSTLRVADNERVAVYRANVSWDDQLFRLDAFYRTGHYHWGYEGDFFGLYREANYGRNIDIYNGRAPSGMEFTGKKQLTGLKFAIGPELWWGANPTALAKYRRNVGGVDVTGLYQEDLAQLTTDATSSSFAIPIPKTRRASLALADTIKGVGIEAGALWAGSTRVGVPFQILDGVGSTARVLQDHIKDSDAFGAKGKLTYTRGRVNWYGQGAVMGLVADGGPTSVQTFTGWSLKDTGLNNQWNVITGFTATFGAWQFAPNVLYQKPIVGPVGADAPAPARPRNILEDPFVVRANRETQGAEMLLTYDPTPGTWMYQWDNDAREDAKLAFNLGYVYRKFPTTMDAAIGILADGRTTFAFPGATPARSLYEVRSRIVSKVARDLRLVANVYTGTAEPNGNDTRLLHRTGFDVRAVTHQLKIQAFAKFNDWGPFDYHRDFNLTFPKQYMGDVSYVLGTPQWFDVPETRVGVRGSWRALDRFSPRFCPERVPADRTGILTCDPTVPGMKGSEWEIRTYLSVNW
jgi:hypothetical protein